MPIKALLMGEAGSGKTCALASLLDAGYQVRVIDADNKIDGLRNILTHKDSKYKRDSIERLAYVTLTERMRMAQGRIIPASANVWPKTIGLLEDWNNADPALGTVAKLGKLTSWDDNCVLVIDTLSSIGAAAMNFGQAMNGVLGNVRTQNEIRRDIGGAQSLVRDLVRLLNDTSIKCHVIVSTHIIYVRADGSGVLTLGDGGDSNVPTQGFPNAIGRAISPEIPRYFGNVLLLKQIGSGAATRRRLYTLTQGNVNLQSNAPLSVAPEYAQETGLADLFKALRAA